MDRTDGRGLEIEVIAVETLDSKTGDPIMLVVHAMPTALRRK